MKNALPRYLLVGITCAVLCNAILIAGDALGFHYVPSLLIAYVIVVLWGYGLHSIFTFARELSVVSLCRYALGMAATLPASIALLFLFCDVASIAVAIAAPATTVIIFLWNFAMTRWAIIGKQKRPSGWISSSSPTRSSFR